MQVQGPGKQFTSAGFATAYQRDGRPVGPVAERETRSAQQFLGIVEMRADTIEERVVRILKLNAPLANVSNSRRLVVRMDTRDGLNRLGGCNRATQRKSH